MFALIFYNIFPGNCRSRGNTRYARFFLIFASYKYLPVLYFRFGTSNFKVPANGCKISAYRDALVDVLKNKNAVDIFFLVIKILCIYILFTNFIKL